MKKLLLVFTVIALMTFPLCSCGGDAPEEPTTTTQADPDAEMKSEAENVVINKLVEDGIPYSKIKPQYQKTEKDGDSYLVYIHTPMVDGTTTETIYRATPVDGMWDIDDGTYNGEVPE